METFLRTFLLEASGIYRKVTVVKRILTTIHLNFLKTETQKTTLKDDVIRLSNTPRVSIILYHIIIIIIIHLIPQIINLNNALE